MPKQNKSMFSVFDVQSTFFIPVWRRVLVVAFSAVWAIVELVNGGPYWALLFGGISAYCAHQFFIAFNPVDKEE